MKPRRPRVVRNVSWSVSNTTEVRKGRPVKKQIKIRHLWLFHKKKMISVIVDKLPRREFISLRDHFRRDGSALAWCSWELAVNSLLRDCSCSPQNIFSTCMSSRRTLAPSWSRWACPSLLLISAGASRTKICRWSSSTWVASADRRDNSSQWLDAVSIPGSPHYSDVQQHDAVVVELPPQFVDMQLQTVLVDAAVLDVPARSSSLAPHQQLVPYPGGSPRFGYWFDVLAKGSLHRKRGTLHNMLRLCLMKCENNEVSILIYIWNHHLGLLQWDRPLLSLELCWARNLCEVANGPIDQTGPRTWICCVRVRTHWRCGGLNGK